MKSRKFSASVLAKKPSIRTTRKKPSGAKQITSAAQSRVSPPIQERISEAIGEPRERLKPRRWKKLTPALPGTVAILPRAAATHVSNRDSEEIDVAIDWLIPPYGLTSEPYTAMPTSLYERMMCCIDPDLARSTSQVMSHRQGVSRVVPSSAETIGSPSDPPWAVRQGVSRVVRT